MLFRSEQEYREQVIALAKEVTFHTLNEKGCKAYDIFESCTRENVLMICETWDKEESIEMHQNTHHYKEFKKGIKDIATIKIEKFDLNTNPDSIH